MKPSRRVQRGFGVDPDWRPALENVRFVLVGTTHAGNIGSVARVMKNMALQNLTLVSSTDCGPETEAYPMASGAYEIVENACRTEDLVTAVSDCVMAVGTSARVGRKRVPTRSIEDLAREILENAFTGPVAVAFGRESRGLTNEELKLCTDHLAIPTDAEFASMNLAQACTVVAYELFKIASRPKGFVRLKRRPASVESREAMYRHIEEVLLRAHFLDEANPLVMMRDIRRILNSADMDDRDTVIIRGIFRKMGNMVRIAEERAGIRDGETADRSDVPQSVESDERDGDE